MNENLLKELQEWLEGGNRSIKVLIDHRWGWYGEEYVEEYYVYSFDVHYGKYITCIKDLPTDGELIKLKEEKEKILDNLIS